MNAPAQRKQPKISDFVRYAPLSVLDAGENIFFQRQLEEILPDILQIEYIEGNAHKVFPIRVSSNPWAQRITYRQRDKFGRAAIISSSSDEVPLLNFEAEEFSGKVRDIQVAAEFSIAEIRSAAREGIDLQRDAAIDAAFEIRQVESATAFTGSHGLVGVLDAGTNIPTSAATGTFATQTGAVIAGDLLQLLARPNEATLGSNMDTVDLLLPVAEFNRISRMQHSAGTDTTVLEYVRRNAPFGVNITPVHELTDRAFAYVRRPDVLQMEMVMDIMSLPPEARGSYIKVLYWARFGGMTIRKPLKARHLTGIA